MSSCSTHAGPRRSAQCTERAQLCVCADMMATESCAEKRKLSVCWLTVTRAPLWAGLPVTKTSPTTRRHS
eukprot:1311289-Rhodomonas_salina.1